MGSYLEYTSQSFCVPASVPVSVSVSVPPSPLTYIRFWLRGIVWPLWLCFLHMSPGDQGRKSPRFLLWAVAAAFLPLPWCSSLPASLAVRFLISAHTVQSFWCRRRLTATKFISVPLSLSSPFFVSRAYHFLAKPDHHKNVRRESECSVLSLQFTPIRIFWHPRVIGKSLTLVLCSP